MTIHQLTVDSALFDLDGTLILSTGAVVAAWTAFHERHGLKLDDEFFHKTHGFRTRETFRVFFPQLDDTDAKASTAFDLSISQDYSHMAVPVPGGAQLVTKIPENRWCIVTSGSKSLAHSWFDLILNSHGLPKPEVFITSDDVDQGKPHPEPYLTGSKALAEKVGVESFSKGVVFEDAPMGIQAGVAAGCVVIGIASTFEPDVLFKSGATYVVKDLNGVKVVKVNDDKSFVLEIDSYDQPKI